MEVHQSAKNCIYNLWSNFRIKYLKVKLWRLWISPRTEYHQKITGIWRNLGVNQYRIPAIFGSSGGTALKQVWFCHGNHCRNTSRNDREHGSLCHPQMQVKAPSSKEEAVYEHDPETLPSSSGQSSFKMENCGQMDQNAKFFLENVDAASSALKRRSSGLWSVLSS